MNERELLEMVRDKALAVGRELTMMKILADEMADKLIELMGEEAFWEWSAPITEEAAQTALAEVKRMDEEAKAEAMRAMSEGARLS